MNLAHDWRSIWLVLASLLAGALNALAGGGSFLSFPALLGMGVLPIQANATNAVALWPGQVTSIAAFREDLKHNLRLLLPIGSASVLGGLGGGLMLLHTGQKTFLRLVPWLLLVAAVLFAASGPVSQWLQRRGLEKQKRDGGDAVQPASVVPLFLSMLVVNFYVGYFGAGAGFLVMSLLAVFGVQSMNEINALKVCTAALANGTAVVAFIIAGRIVWHYCLLMMIAAAIGGYLGGRYSRKLDPAIGRVLVVALGLGMAAYFFWRQR